MILDTNPSYEPIQVGSLKDALAEIPELWQYTVSTTIWWFEFGTTLFGVYCAAEASACSSGLRYAASTLGGCKVYDCTFYMFRIDPQYPAKPPNEE